MRLLLRWDWQQNKQHRDAEAKISARRATVRAAAVRMQDASVRACCADHVVSVCSVEGRVDALHTQVVDMKVCGRGEEKAEIPLGNKGLNKRRRVEQCKFAFIKHHRRGHAVRL